MASEINGIATTQVASFIIFLHLLQLTAHKFFIYLHQRESLKWKKVQVKRWKVRETEKPSNAKDEKENLLDERKFFIKNSNSYHTLHSTQHQRPFQIHNKSDSMLKSIELRPNKLSISHLHSPTSCECRIYSKKAQSRRKVGKMRNLFVCRFSLLKWVRTDFAIFHLFLPFSLCVFSNFLKQLSLALINFLCEWTFWWRVWRRQDENGDFFSLFENANWKLPFSLRLVDTSIRIDMNAKLFSYNLDVESGNFCHFSSSIWLAFFG